ncbi:MAG: hypothetical protein M1561_04365 [Gammaproteobacteria bacterium]|nr:hypothetical protein [Gammaproteobacteria bacterium]
MKYFIDHLESIFALIVSFAAAMYARKSARAAQQANQDNRDRYEKSQRPFIGYAEAKQKEVTQNGEQHWYPYFAFKNIGKNPLHKLKVTVSQGSSGKDLKHIKQPSESSNPIISGEIVTLNEGFFDPVSETQTELFVRICFTYNDAIMGISYDQPPFYYVCSKDQDPFAVHTPEQLIGK